jgi:probable rRNA maturation factor
MSLEIDIRVEAEAWRELGDLDNLARRAIEIAWEASGEPPRDDAEVSIVLCDDAFIADLNARWRGIAKPTNVLSFPVDDAHDQPALGDIVIAHETVAREASEEGKTTRDHLAHMIVHGFLHLLGFDHEDDADADAMEAVEILALARLGVASPYGSAPPPLSPPTAEDRRSPR